jgi:tetratricopeptide (TPR) repeat protein
LLTVLAATPAPTFAQQYRSEVRELERPPAEQPPADVQKLLQETTDPYERALLLRELAGRYAREGNYREAARFLEQALEQKALSPIAERAMRDDLAQLHVATGDPHAVVRGLEPLVRGNRDASPEQLAALGAAYVNLKRFRDALPLLQRAADARDPPDENILRALLAAHLGLNQDRDAAAVVDRLLRINPRNREYWLHAAALHLKAGDKRRAHAVMELAGLQGFLQSQEERLHLVSLTAELGAPFEAGSLMQGWMESEALPDNRDNRRTLAALWIAAREAQLAIAAINAALALGADNQLLLQLGQLHMDREQYAQAARAFERAIEGGARGGQNYMALAVARYQQADIEAALRAFHAASEFAPQRALATEWVKYLETGKAREQALTAAAQRRRREADDVELSARLLGAPVGVTMADRAGQSALAGPDGLTPIGAEGAGNADGTIPPWTGGLTPDHWPAGFVPGKLLNDPFAEDKPLFTITADNMGQYAQRLSSGHRELLRRHATYRMHVYPTRRSASYPQAIYDATQKNAGRAMLIGSDALSDARLGFPFPRPESGVEIMWNHRVRWRGNSVMATTTQAVVQASGTISHQLRQTERVYYRYANLDDPVDLEQHNTLLYYLTWFSESGRSADFLALVHESGNSLKDRRSIWVMPPGIRRMFRIPPVGYDQPFPGSGGLYFVDMVDMYNGAFDRYVWRLVGKRELYIPYNGYRIGDGSYRYRDLLTPGHFNQDAARYELHRVWVIEATEREGRSHSFGKRTFYVDEDTWNVVLVENHDRQGQLWRFQEGHLLALYDTQSANALPVVTYDLKDGRYFASRLLAEEQPPQYDLPNIGSQEFMPAAVRTRYAR